jgi:hypothetical protein
MKFSREVMPLSVTSMPYFLILSFKHSKMADVQTSENEQLLIRPFLSKTKKYEHGGRLDVKIHSLFCGGNS